MHLTTLEKHVHPAAIVLAGVALAFLSALAPTKAHAVQLLPLQVVVGLLPYVVFGMIAAMLRAPIVQRAGLIVLGIHLLTAIAQRGLNADHGSGPTLIIVPILATIALMALWPRAVRATAIDSGAPAAVPKQSG